jgi:hypothetical protein
LLEQFVEASLEVQETFLELAVPALRDALTVTRARSTLVP